MESFNSGAVGSAATVLSGILSRIEFSARVSGRYAGVNVRPKLLKRGVQTPMLTTFFISNMQKDKAKFLSHQQMSLIVTAVKFAPLVSLSAMYKILRPNNLAS